MIANKGIMIFYPNMLVCLEQVRITKAVFLSMQHCVHITHCVKRSGKGQNFADRNQPSKLNFSEVNKVLLFFLVKT